MANQKKRLATNVVGEFFVDSTCIDCDACRQIAPANFAEYGDYSSVQKQPENEREEREAWRALLACPVGSIGSLGANRAKEIQDDFPLHVDGEIYYCGFNSRDSYGANSYLIKHPEGNWLVESPRYVKRLAEKIKELGGIKYIFLSHRDDVADADKYSAEFESKRIIHEADISAQPDSEIVLSGDAPVTMGEDFEIIPTPGHSKGHCVLLYKKKYLFTGDHLYWDRSHKQLGAFERYCWYSWDKQRDSMKRLLDYQFDWVLPGHGQSVHLTADKMHEQLLDLVERM